MKSIRFLPVFAAALVSGCTHAEPTTCTVVPGKGPPDVRVSDKYSRRAVASYEAYEVEIPEHTLALIRLKDGTRLPMLCRLEAGNIRPLPQSVFTEGGPKAWHIMVEPKIQHGNTTSYALMSMEFRLVDGSLVSRDGKALKRMDNKPNLAALPAA